MIADIAITTLGEVQCPDSDSPYMVVSTENPRDMEAIKGELELQKDPAFDPASRVTPRLIAATHLLKGSFTIDGDRAIANLRIEDRSGNVIASATGEASMADFWKAVDSAAKALAADLCKEDKPSKKKPELERYQQMNKDLLKEQQVREQSAGARVKRYADSIR